MKRNAWKHLPRPLSKSSKSKESPLATPQGWTIPEEVEPALVLRPLVTFRLIVIAWRRLASLRRLMDSLAAAHYHGFTVHLDFFLDGEAHPKVLEYVEGYSWKHGDKAVKARETRLGLEQVRSAGSHYHCRSFCTAGRIRPTMSMPFSLRTTWLRRRSFSSTPYGVCSTTSCRKGSPRHRVFGVSALSDSHSIPRALMRSKCP